MLDVFYRQTKLIAAGADKGNLQALPDVHRSHPHDEPSRTPGAGSIVIAAIEGELTARPFTALDGEEAHVWGVVAGVVRSLP